MISLFLTGGCWELLVVRRAPARQRWPARRRTVSLTTARLRLTRVRQVRRLSGSLNQLSTAARQCSGIISLLRLDMAGK